MLQRKDFECNCDKTAGRCGHDGSVNNPKWFIRANVVQDGFLFKTPYL